LSSSAFCSAPETTMKEIVLSAVFVVALAVLGFKFLELQDSFDAQANELVQLQSTVDTQKVELADVKTRLYRYEEVEPRSKNLPWLGGVLDEVEQSFLSFKPDFNDSVPKLRQEWGDYLKTATPAAFEEEVNEVDCRTEAIIAAKDLLGQDLKPEVRDPAVMLLRECGFVYLDDLFDKELLRKIRRAYEDFKTNDPDVGLFRYPCQGTGRLEHMLPFRPPFNESEVYGDRRLLSVVMHHLKARFKLELISMKV